MFLGLLKLLSVLFYVLLYVSLVIIVAGFAFSFIFDRRKCP